MQPESPNAGRSYNTGPITTGNLERVSAPATEPVTLALAKNHLRITDYTDDDALISGLITAAREFCEKAQNRIYIESEMTYSLSGIPSVGREIWLPVLPIKSIDKVIIAQKGTENGIEIPADQYDVDLKDGKLALNRSFATDYDADLLPRYNGFIIEFTAGYGEPADVPQIVKQAILLIVGHLYEHREETSDGKELKEIPMGATRMLRIDKAY